MKSDHIFKAIGDAEDQFLERTENASKIKRIPLPWAKWGAVAECACFVFIGAFAFKSFTPSGSGIEVPGASDGIVSSFPSSVSGIYDSPGNGEVLLFTIAHFGFSRAGGTRKVQSIICADTTPSHTFRLRLSL